MTDKMVQRVKRFGGWVGVLTVLGAIVAFVYQAGVGVASRPTGAEVKAQIEQHRTNEQHEITSKDAATKEEVRGINNKLDRMDSKLDRLILRDSK